MRVRDSFEADSLERVLFDRHSATLERMFAAWGEEILRVHDAPNRQRARDGRHIADGSTGNRATDPDFSRVPIHPVTLKPMLVHRRALRRMRNVVLTN